MLLLNKKLFVINENVVNINTNTNDFYPVVKFMLANCLPKTRTIKAASSDERDLAPGLTANGGFRKTANVEQYAFKVIKIGGICQSHLYVPNFLLPAGGAMTITGYWHVDVFRPAHLSNI